MKRKVNLNFLFKREFKRKIVSLVVMVSLVAFSFVPMATSAPVQDDAVGSWSDSFSDDTGIDLTKSSAIDVSGGDVIFNNADWTRDDPWGIEIVDSLGDVGDINSIVVDSNGIPHIVYYDATNGKFKYAYWDGSNWNKQVIPDGCPWPSFLLMGAISPIDIAVDSNDNLHIAYFCGMNRHARYIRWNGTGWDSQTKISGNITTPVFSISIAVDNTNIPHVAYNNSATDPDRIFYAKGPAWTLEPVLEVADRVNSYNISIALDSSNIPYLIYDDSSGNIKYAVRNGAPWNIGVVGATGLPIATISFGAGLNIDSATGEIRVISTVWSNFNCMFEGFPFGFCRGHINEFISSDMGSSWNDNLILSGSHDGFVGGTYYTGSYCNSISSKPLGGNDNLQISYTYSDDGEFGDFYMSSLWFMERLSSVGVWNKVEVDSSVEIGINSVAQDNNNLPHIAYYDTTNNDLRYAGCPFRGTVISKEITPTVLDSWDTFSATDNTTNGSITYSILDGSDFSIIKNNVTSGQDISDINAIAHPTIRLKASISATGDPAISAILHDWGVEWVTDATPPAVTTEAYIPDEPTGTFITKSPSGTVNLDNIDEAGEHLTLYSNATDASTIQDQKIKWWHYDSEGFEKHKYSDIGMPSYHWNAANPTAGGLNSLILTSALNFEGGDRIEYQSEATDSAVPPNPTTYDPINSEACGAGPCGDRYSFTIVAAPVPPTCSISTPESAVVGTAFDIDVNGSEDPDGNINNAQIRFSVDDVKDDNQTGVWTNWFSWTTDDSDGLWIWNATTKKVSYTFSTVGDKEIWMEIEDESSLTCQNNKDMNATAANAPPTALFNAVAN